MINSLLSATGDVGKNLAEALLPEKVKFLGMMVGPSLLTALGVTLGLSIIALILRFTVIKKMKNVPSPLQSMLEMLVSAFDKSAKESTHSYSVFIGPYIMAAAIFICVGTLVELLNIRPAMADINTCFAFGIATFIVINFSGVKKKGVGGRLRRYLNPINIITDIAVPVSLSFRLFGSIVSGLLIMELVYSFLATSFVIPAGIAVITTLFHAFIQAYIFSTLSSLFVGEAIE